MATDRLCPVSDRERQARSEALCRVLEEIADITIRVIPAWRRILARSSLPISP
jgi:hypothetical protein